MAVAGAFSVSQTQLVDLEVSVDLQGIIYYSINRYLLQMH